MDNNLKPRERLKHHEINTVSDAELIAIVLGTGSHKNDVITTANNLLVECNGLTNMQSSSIEDFKLIHGIGDAKASLLFAMFEISKRANNQKFYLEPQAVNKPEIVHQLCSEMAQYMQEKVVVLCLNIRMELISKNEVYVGELSSVTIEPREIFKTAFVKSAYAFILVHNHPSGYSEASDDDVISTLAICKAARMLNVLFIDHIVIAKDGFYSIRSNHPSCFESR